MFHLACFEENKYKGQKVSIYSWEEGLEGWIPNGQKHLGQCLTLNPVLQNRDYEY